MKVECITHGDVEGYRDDAGKLVCSVCVALKQAQAKEADDDAQRRTRAKKLVQDMLDPERMAAFKREREVEFKTALEDAFVNQFKHMQKN